MNSRGSGIGNDMFSALAPCSAVATRSSTASASASSAIMTVGSGMAVCLSSPSSASISSSSVSDAEYAAAAADKQFFSMNSFTVQHSRLSIFSSRLSRNVRFQLADSFVFFIVLLVASIKRF